MRRINDFVLHVATVNGSGSQSANNILVKSLFRMDVPVGGKNLFPSNIQGLPTWFTIRVNDSGFTARRGQYDVVVAMNASTAQQDALGLQAGGTFIYNKEFRLDPKNLRSDVRHVEVPFRELVDTVTDSIKLKKLLVNVIYVGILAELLGIEDEVVTGVVRDTFQDKAKLIEQNLLAYQRGRQYARENLSPVEFEHKVEPRPGLNKGKILIDGNSASALGLLFGGCSFVAWYPITPSSSLVETFQRYAEAYRTDASGTHSYAVVQAEDELSSICMVVGAGWAGARAMTATSGPGLSLMSEAAGLSYYAEIPAVIWDVQRVGPSTGLPTRTMQGDLSKATLLSHGDTKQVVLLPGNMQECFEFGQSCFDLAEQLNTLVIVLTDLDLGMNFHVTPEFQVPKAPFKRGKVLSAADLDKNPKWGRYLDQDGDGITPRTLPGTAHDAAAYFARGTGHDEYANYSENNEVFKRNMKRLAKKYETAKTLVPKPVVNSEKDAEFGIIAFGSSDGPMAEARSMLRQQGIKTDYLRLRAIPFTKEVEDFIKSYRKVYVVEQNRDAQLMSLLRMEFPELATRLASVVQFDGLPLEARFIFAEISGGGTR